MNQGPTDKNNGRAILEAIAKYVGQSSGLTGGTRTEDSIEIHQKADGKSLRLDMKQIEDLIPRADNDGRDFLQVNFNSGHKILITDDLIGFKPQERNGLDMDKLPKVVTTPDLMSVFEAIQEALHSEEARPEEIEILRRVFESVVRGGEAVGFDLKQERHWFSRLPTQSRRASA